MRTARLAAMLIAAMGVIRVHAQISAANTPEGFQSQFHAVCEAFQQHNEAAMQDRLQSFAIPSHWFTDSFAPARQQNSRASTPERSPISNAAPLPISLVLTR
jgi:hypothetical protein